MFSSFTGAICLVSATLVLSLIGVTCAYLPASPFRWVAYLVGVGAGLAYCVPWGVFTGPVEPDEKPYA
ncbi:hypothetical protein WJ87_04710 [Burkholderia ubonensis]|nr:hypothetical protein WJ87_04710 [Burkholderia ubonensis]